MVSKLKVAGAVLAVLAMSAAMTTGAQASALFEASEYPAEIVGEETETIVFEAEELGAVECEVATVEGELTAPASILVLTPDFEECSASGLEATFVNSGECKLIAYAGEEVEEDVFEAPMDIACAEEEAALKFHIPFTHCILSAGGQVGITDLTYFIHKLIPFHISIAAKLGEIQAAIEDTAPDKCGIGTGMIKLSVKGGITLKVPGGISLFITK